MTQEPTRLPQVTSDKSVGIQPQNVNADLTFAEKQKALEAIVSQFVMRYPKRDRAKGMERVGDIAYAMAGFIRQIETLIPDVEPCMACGEDLVDMTVEQKLRHFKRHGWMRRQLAQLRNMLFN